MDIIESLTNFNLTRQEATIYTALFAEGELTGYEVAKLTGISRSNIYTSLAGLVEKGAVYLVEGAVNRYTPVPVDEFCANRIRQLQYMQGDILKKMPHKKEAAEGYITIKGRKHIIDKMKNMLLEAKERIYLSVSNSTLDIVQHELEDSLSRGLKLVIITNQPFVLAGATVYHTEKPSHEIRLIVDSSYVLTGDIMDGDNSTCLYSKKKNLVDIIKESIKNEIMIIELVKGRME